LTYNVTIDGFTIEGGSSGSYASGIYVDHYRGSATEAQILNNIIQNNAIGVYLYDSYYTLVEYNLFKNNNVGTAGSSFIDFNGQAGIGIAAYGASSYAISITENAFAENLGAALWLIYVEYMEITKNTSEKDGAFLECTSCFETFIDHNQGKDFGALGITPVFGYAPGAAMEMTYSNAGLQINDNVLEKGKTAGYNGISFSTAFSSGQIVCEYCQVSNNTVRGFAGSGIVAQPTSPSTLQASMVSRNYIEDNGEGGILLGNSSYYNQLEDNKAQGNHPNDCEDDTAPNGSYTAETYNTWINNSGSLSSPTGLCSPGGWWH
jgi:parallel beta-helix repeat protein